MLLLVYLDIKDKNISFDKRDTFKELNIYLFEMLMPKGVYCAI